MSDLVERLRDFNKSEAVRIEAADRIEQLEREIRYLRHYGNKDCTAMADAAMENNELES